MNKKILVLLIGGSLFSTAFAESILYRYKNSQGKIVYSDSVPANEKGHIDILSARTMTLVGDGISKQLSAEEIETKNNVEKEQKDIFANSELSKQKDQALLANYSSLDDIEKMKAYELQQINRTIQNDTDNLSTLKDKKIEIDNKNKKAIGNLSPKTEQESKDLQQTIENITSNLEKNKKLYENREQKYNEDKIKYLAILDKMGQAKK